MPQAVTHILLPILIVAFFRDFYLRKKEKKNFPLHYVLFAGLGGVLPDIDIAISALLQLAGVGNWNIHQTLTHSFIFPLALFAIFLIFKPMKAHARICNIGRHNLSLSTIFLMLAFGSLVHIVLDFIFGPGLSPLFYPLSQAGFGLAIFTYFPESAEWYISGLLDGVLLVVWIAYLELKHKISDFI